MACRAPKCNNTTSSSDSSPRPPSRSSQKRWDLKYYEKLGARPKEPMKRRGDKQHTLPKKNRPQMLEPQHLPSEERAFVFQQRVNDTWVNITKPYYVEVPSHVMEPYNGEARRYLSDVKARTINLAPPKSEPDVKKMEEGIEDGLPDSTQDLSTTGRAVLKPWVRLIKICLLFLLWLLFTTILIMKSEKELEMHQISIPEGEIRSYWLREHPINRKLEVSLRGSFLPEYYGNMSDKYLSVWIQLVEIAPGLEPVANITAFNAADIVYEMNISDTWDIPIVSKELLDFVPDVDNKKVFCFRDFDVRLIPRSILRIQMKSNMDVSFPTAFYFDLSPIDTDSGIVYAAIVLIGLYVIIILEVVPRTLAAMLASTMSVAILASMNERPTMKELISWIDIETLLLLFSMMMLVAIFSETGVFDFLAVLAYKITNGKVWPLVNTLCFITAAMSMFLDNVTTVLLMTPVTIRLCEVTGLNPVPVLMATVIYSNIGGSVTPVGDPPNAIIASNEDVENSGVDFGIFTLHMGLGIVFVAISTYLVMRYVIFRDMDTLRYKEPQDVEELRHEIWLWHRAAESLSSYSRDEDTVRKSLEQKVKCLCFELKRRLISGSVTVDTYKQNLEELQVKKCCFLQYPIRSIPLLIKSGLCLIFVITLFFLHSIPNLNLSLGWSALLGAILLLVLADKDEMEGVLGRIEWGTLLFFASLFILMEALSRLGLINWIGRQTEAVILSVNEESRLAVAILLILWVSAIASAFVDNIPLTTMMVRIVTNLNVELNLPLQPLVWALALGACLGGNGTLIGASANVVCAGVAEQHGFRFTFMQYFKVGFPVMIVSILVSSVYLMVCHVALQWH